MGRHSNISDDEAGDKCFEALPDDTYQAIGSNIRVIKKVIREQYNLPVNVIKYLRFTHVTPTVAEKLSLKSVRQLYSHESRCMIVKLATGAHEVALNHLGVEVTIMIRDMGLGGSIDQVGERRGQGFSSSKEPDQSWYLTQPVTNRDAKWPTVVVEVGVSEAYRKLKADAEWWLSNSKGDVNLVIIVSISRTAPKIKFETVLLEPTSLRNQRSRYVTKIRQSITTSRSGGQVTTSPAEALKIEFKEMFCRQPVPPEHDIEISPEQLTDISTRVWRHQGL